MEFTLGEKLALLTITAKDWSFMINLAKTVTGPVLFLPRPIRDKIVAYGAKRFLT